MNIWNILGIVAIVLLIIFWWDRNAVWGGLTIGIFIGLVLAIISVFKKTGFDLVVIKNSAIVGVLVGFMAELLGRAGNLLKGR